MSVSNLVVVLLIATALGVAERRWRVPFLKSGVHVAVGLILLQIAMKMSPWRQYLFGGLGVAWIVWGVNDFMRQRAARRTEEG